jgi:hypothetical protein
MLEELGGADELDGTTELLLGSPFSLEELGGADELDGSTELLLGSPSSLEELGRTDELDGSTEPPLETTLEEDGSSPASTLDDEPSTKAFPM